MLRRPMISDPYRGLPAEIRVRIWTYAASSPLRFELKEDGQTPRIIDWLLLSIAQTNKTIYEEVRPLLDRPTVYDFSLLTWHQFDRAFKNLPLWARQQKDVAAWRFGGKGIQDRFFGPNIWLGYHALNPREARDYCPSLKDVTFVLDLRACRHYQKEFENQATVASAVEESFVLHWDTQIMPYLTTYIKNDRLKSVTLRFPGATYNQLIEMTQGHALGFRLCSKDEPGKSKGFIRCSQRWCYRPDQLGPYVEGAVPYSYMNEYVKNTGLVLTDDIMAGLDGMSAQSADTLGVFEGWLSRELVREFIKMLDGFALVIFGQRGQLGIIRKHMGTEIVRPTIQAYDQKPMVVPDQRTVFLSSNRLLGVIGQMSDPKMVFASTTRTISAGDIMLRRPLITDPYRGLPTEVRTKIWMYAASASPPKGPGTRLRLRDWPLDSILKANRTIREEAKPFLVFPPIVDYSNLTWPQFIEAFRALSWAYKSSVGKFVINLRGVQKALEGSGRYTPFYEKCPTTWLLSIAKMDSYVQPVLKSITFMLDTHACRAAQLSLINRPQATSPYSLAFDPVDISLRQQWSTDDTATLCNALKQDHLESATIRFSGATYNQMKVMTRKNALGFRLVPQDGPGKSKGVVHWSQRWRYNPNRLIVTAEGAVPCAHMDTSLYDGRGIEITEEIEINLSKMSAEAADMLGIFEGWIFVGKTY